MTITKVNQGKVTASMIKKKTIHPKGPSPWKFKSCYIDMSAGPSKISQELWRPILFTYYSHAPPPLS